MNPYRLNFFRHSFPFNGPPDPDDYNDSMQEIEKDISNLETTENATETEIETMLTNVWLNPSGAQGAMYVEASGASLEAYDSEVDLATIQGKIRNIADQIEMIEKFRNGA